MDFVLFCFANSFEIYEEAIKILGIYQIDRIAIIQPGDKFTKALAANTRNIYEKLIKYRVFTDIEQARAWLNEPGSL